MPTLQPAQISNIRAGLEAAHRWAVQHGVDPLAVMQRVAFGMWTEGNGWNHANDGAGYQEPAVGRTSWNQTGTPESRARMRAILRRSLLLPHDQVGSNGRSTGPLQQLSAETGGAWGDMAGTMHVPTSVGRFCARLRVTDDPVYVGTLQTPTGSRRVSITLSDPIAADVLRVQEPLADEAESPNYNAAQVKVARDLVTAYAPTTPDVQEDIMATREDLQQDIKDGVGDVPGQVWRQPIGIGYAAGDVLGSLLPMLSETNAMLRAQLKTTDQKVIGRVTLEGKGIAEVDIVERKLHAYGAEEFWQRAADLEKAGIEIVDFGAIAGSDGEIDAQIAAHGWSWA